VFRPDLSKLHRLRKSVLAGKLFHSLAVRLLNKNGLTLS